MVGAILGRQVKLSYLGLASLERTIARKRARIASLMDGDANTSFYHRQCTQAEEHDSLPRCRQRYAL